MKKKAIINSLYNVLLKTGFKDSYILEITKYSDTLKVNIKLPHHRQLDDLIMILPNLQMEMNALDCKIGKVRGKIVEVLFGMKDLSDIPFNEKYLHKNTIKVELPSAYGSSILDFSDGASCHLLNGGTTRMGKTVFLLYLSTVLYVQMKGKIQLYISSTKLKDFYPFFDLPNVECSRTDMEMLSMLETIIDEYHKRDQLLYSNDFIKATDAKSVLKHYPDKYYLFRPVFLIIDEYARFSDNREIQKKVMELVETAGYVNIHVIIASQRPDARSVLPPRIKTNLLARICFTTVDKNNSIVILDQEGAEKLGKIAGRAIYLDSEANIIQVPYLSTDKCECLLQPFRRDQIETDVNQETKGSINHTLSEKIQGMFSESTSEISVLPKQQPDKRVQSSDETISNGWFLLEHTKNKG